METFRKIIKTCLPVVAAVLVLFSAAAGTIPAFSAEEGGAATGSSTISLSEETVMSVTGTDDFSRKIDTIEGYRKDRYVGLFYFIWFEFAQKGYRFDTTKLLRTKPDKLWDPFDKTGTAPASCMYYFNEPLYGYYKSTDKWVVRKHIELFIAAGIDFIAIDLSNDVIYENALVTLLDTMMEFHNAGYKVPQVVCYTNLNTGHTVDLLYKVIYNTDKYKPLWFYGPYDKPLMVAHKEELADKYNEFFYVRPAQWPGFEYEVYEDGFPFCDLNRPQRTHQNLIGVSVAQHTAYVFSYGMKVDPHDTPRDINHGRGFTSKNPVNGDPVAIMRGDNIEEQWDYAISQDPEIVFVTGWNEWATNKWPGNEGDTVARFVDSFNTEFSRDIEMTKERRYEGSAEEGYTSEGYADNYYLQLVRNVRRYKGITGTCSYTAPSSPEALTGRDYLSLAVANEPRNCGGYKQAAADNFIKKIRVSHTSSELIFKIECENEITAPGEGQTNWMNVFFGFEGSKEQKWETYSYLINRRPGEGEGERTTSVDKYDGKAFTPLGECALTVEDSVMIVRVPLELLPELKDAYGFVMDFKVADSVEVEDDIMDYYVSGSSVPIGRLSYTYAGKIKDKPAEKKGGCGSVAGAGKAAGTCLVLGTALGAATIAATKKKAGRKKKRG